MYIEQLKAFTFASLISWLILWTDALSVGHKTVIGDALILTFCTLMLVLVLLWSAEIWT